MLGGGNTGLARPGDAGTSNNLFSPLSVQGPMARNIPDLALGLDAMAGYDPLDPLTFDAPAQSFVDAVANAKGGLRVAFTANFGGRLPVDRETREICAREVRRFEQAGCTVEEAFPELGPVEDVFLALRSQHFVVDRELQIARPHVALRVALLGAIASAGNLYMVLVSLVFDASPVRGPSDVALYVGLVAGWEVPAMLLLPRITHRMARSSTLALGAAVYGCHLLALPLLSDTIFLWPMTVFAGVGGSAVITTPIPYYQDLLRDRPPGRPVEARSDGPNPAAAAGRQARCGFWCRAGVQGEGTAQAARPRVP